MKEFHNQFFQLAERHISMDHTRCQLVSPQRQKYETGSLLSSLYGMNLTPTGFGTAFFSLPRF